MFGGQEQKWMGRHAAPHGEPGRIGRGPRLVGPEAVPQPQGRHTDTEELELASETDTDDTEE